MRLVERNECGKLDCALTIKMWTKPICICLGLA
jgi:hypothetical protein